MNSKPLILVGGGGHCKSVIEAAESAGHTILGVLDLPDTVGNEVLGYRIIGTDDDIASYVDKADFVVTVGAVKSPALRIKLHQKITSVGGCLATIIASSASVSRHAVVGAGTVVLHRACVNADASIGVGCIVNTGANIEHDVSVGDYTHVSTGAMVNGGCSIGEGCFIGSGAVVANCLTVGPGIVVGAGAVVCRSLTQKGIYVGCPAVLKSSF